jgi:hypothetical protein
LKADCDDAALRFAALRQLARAKIAFLAWI